MKIKYTVHTVSRESFERKAVLEDGREMTVMVPGLALELVSDCGVMGHTLRMIPDDIDAAEAAATPGTEAEITVTFGTPAPVVKPDHTAEYAVHEEIAKAIEEGREPPPMPGMETAESGGDE